VVVSINDLFEVAGEVITPRSLIFMEDKEDDLLTLY